MIANLDLSYQNYISNGLRWYFDEKEGGELDMKGTVKFFNDMKNYGFIEPEDGEEDLFVHRSDLEDANFLQEDDEVEFEVGEGERGPRAEKVQKL